MPTLVLAGLAPAMETAIGEVMEAMAFMEAFRRVPLDFAPTEPVYCTRLPVYRPEPAVIGMAVPHSLALTMAGNMLGRRMDPHADGLLVKDALGELVNMLAGSLLNLVVPEAHGFELGLPVCVEITNPLDEPTWPLATTYQFTAGTASMLTTWQSCREPRLLSARP